MSNPPSELIRVDYKPIGGIDVGNTIRFKDDEGSWLVRARTADGRYLLATSQKPGGVYYTLIDWNSNRRGAMNVIGNGLSIFSTEGPDPAIDEAIKMLEDPDDGWELSHRNNVPLRISEVK